MDCTVTLTSLPWLCLDSMLYFVVKSRPLVSVILLYWAYLVTLRLFTSPWTTSDNREMVYYSNFNWAIILSCPGSSASFVSLWLSGSVVLDITFFMTVLVLWKVYDHLQESIDKIQSEDRSAWRFSGHHNWMAEIFIYSFLLCSTLWFCLDVW